MTAGPIREGARMRRPAGYLLLGLGVFLIGLAPLLRFYVYPTLVKAPLDQDSQTVSVAEDATFLAIAALEVREGQTLTATRRVRGDVSAGSDDRAVWDIFVRVEDAEQALVTASTDRVAFDRKTQEAVNCCDEGLNGAPVKHEGIEYKFPFGAEKKTYEYFDTTLGEALPMEYEASEELEGLTVYRYVQTIEPAPIAELDVPGDLVGRSEDSVPVQRYYSNTRTVWVEPTSGAIVKGQEEQFSTLRDDTGEDVLTVTEATLVFTDETIKEQADTAKDARSQIRMLSILGPLVLLLLGIVLVAIGVWLLNGRRDDDGGSADMADRKRQRSPSPASV